MKKRSMNECFSAAADLFKRLLSHRLNVSYFDSTWVDAERADKCVMRFCFDIDGSYCHLLGDDDIMREWKIGTDLETIVKYATIWTEEKSK